MRPQHMLLAALLCAAGIASADPIIPAGTAAETKAAIQSAIDAAGNGGTVTLGAGLFEIDSQLMVTNGVTLAGQGWEDTVIKPASGKSIRCVALRDGAKLVGVTVTGGKTTTNWQHGSGVLVEDGTVSWCCITNNTSIGRNIYGVGVSFLKGSIDHSIVAFNNIDSYTSAGGGIGAYYDSSKPSQYGPILVDTCLVYGNSVVAKNSTGTAPEGRGGGVGFSGTQFSDVTIRNTTIADNDANYEAGGLYFNTSNMKLVNCIVSGNTVTSVVNNVIGTPASGSSNNLVGDDPVFVDAANNNYHLSANSPAIGAGVAYADIGVDLDDVAFLDPPSIGCYQAGGVAKVKSPVFFPASGTRFYPSTNVTISCETEGAAIYYTLDGSDPTDSSTLYEGPIALSATTTVKARAYKTDMAPSAVASATYVYKAPAPKPDGFLKCVDISLASALSETEITTGLPALVRLSESAIDGFDYDDFSLANGGDMMFVDEDGNPLPHEVDTWDQSGESLVWVKLPSTAAGTTITMYYGNGAVSSAEPEDVWSGYVGVWHLNEAFGDAQDATGHGLAAVPTGANAAADSVGVACKFGNGRQMATAQGNKSYLAVADSPLLDCGDSLTFSGWFKAKETFANYSMRYVSRKNAYTDANGWEAEALYSTNPDNSAKMIAARGADSAGGHQTSVPDIRENWVHLAIVYDGSELVFYVNGLKKGPIAMSGTTATDNDLPLAFGNNAAGTESNWVGFMDELRLSADARSADYAIAEYNAMNMSGTDVFSYGDVQDAGSATRVRNPVFFPVSGTTFHSPIDVTLACATADASIYYTLDGSDPTDASTLYEGPIAISATTTVKARAYKQDLEPSAVVSATYTYVEGLLPGATPAETRWTIQAAIDAAAPTHGTVTLGKGIFEIDAQLMVTSGVTLVGQGWEDTVIRQTAYGRDTRVATVDGGAAVERVTLTGGNIAQVTLNGKASANWKNGAGAYVADGTISWCCISNNVSRGGNDNYGGGVFILKGRIDHSVVADNRVSTTTGIQAFGGGIAARHLAGPVVIESCLVRGNSVVNNAKAGFGGGIAVEYLSNDRYTSISVRNTTIVGNSAGEDGGTVAAKGGAVFTTVNSQPDGLNGFSMIDCIVADNATAGADAAMSLSDTRAVDWCLFDVAADAIGANSLVGDPAFVDAADDDYRLTLESPAVGSGESYEGLGTDLAGADFSDPPSMGCYEYGDLAAKPVFDPESGTEFILSTNVAIACATTGATIYYTTDGSRPTTSSAVYNGPITVSERTTIKARAFAEGVGPSAIATAVFSDGTIPLEPIVLGEPVSRPGRDFNGSVVTVDFTGDVPEGAEPTAKVTIDGVDYPGTVDAEHGTVTIVVPATAVTAGNTYSATVTLTVDGVDYTRTTTLEQGRPAIEEAQDWIYETASTFGETGAWSGEKALVAGEAIAVSNATFTAATAAPSNAVVTIRSTFSFGDASDDAFETSSRAGITVVPVDGVARYAVLTADGAATNLSVVANTASAVAVEIRIDGAANTVAYSVDGVSLGSYPMAAKEDGVSTMHYDGATAVVVLEGSYYLDWLDTNVARAGDTEYPTVEEAVRSGKEPVELLWDASWDPTTPGSYTITTNGYDLVVGGDLSSSVVDNGDGTITVTVTDDTVHVRASSITVGATTVRVGVEGIKAGHWYALEKTTDLAQDFVLDDSTWTSAADLLAGTGELEIALGEDEPCAFYQIRESETAPAVP